MRTSHSAIYNVVMAASAYLQRCEMDDAVNIRMVLKNLIEGAIVGDVEVVKLRSLAANQLNPVDSLFGRIVQIVGNDDLVPGFQQSQCGERSYVSGASARICISLSRN